MATAGDLIGLAFRMSGVLGQGQNALTQDTADALVLLNQMMDQWSARRWLVYHLVETVCACDGTISYSVGAGQDIAVARPDRIEYAFIRQITQAYPNQVDWPLVEIKSREQYSQIALKSMQASPSWYFFYDSGFPYGTFYPWPLPNSQYELHVGTKAVLDRFASTATSVVLPPAYESAITLNLAVMMREGWQLAERPRLTKLARKALNTIRGSNFQIGALLMPPGITPGPSYNIYSDRGA